MHKSFAQMIAELRQQENEKKETGLIQKLKKEQINKIVLLLI